MEISIKGNKVKMPNHKYAEEYLTLIYLPDNFKLMDYIELSPTYMSKVNELNDQEEFHEMLDELMTDFKVFNRLTHEDLGQFYFHYDSTSTDINCPEIVLEIFQKLDLILSRKIVPHEDGSEWINIPATEARKINVIRQGGWGVKYGGWGQTSK